MSCPFCSPATEKSVMDYLESALRTGRKAGDGASIDDYLAVVMKSVMRGMAPYLSKPARGDVGYLSLTLRPDMDGFHVFNWENLQLVSAYSPRDGVDFSGPTYLPTMINRGGILGVPAAMTDLRKQMSDGDMYH